MARDNEPLIQGDLAGLQRVKQHVEGHDLGEGGRITRFIGIAGMKYFMSIRIDHDGGVLFGVSRLGKQACRHQRHRYSECFQDRW